MTNQYVSEIDVIIATAHWLHSNGWVLQIISVPKGEGIDHATDKERLKSKLLASNIPLPVRFESKGPDIIASFNGGIWKIECKGLGKGKAATLRNNFDRALSSTVSYYDSKIGLRLGLAMPKNGTYLHLIRSKIPQALRETLILWVFLYNADINTIEAIDPTSELPTKYKYIDEL